MIEVLSMLGQVKITSACSVENYNGSTGPTTSDHVMPRAPTVFRSSDSCTVDTRKRAPVATTSLIESHDLAVVAPYLPFENEFTRATIKAH